MSTMMPPPDPRHGHHGPVRRCQHCERDIELRADSTWRDREGFRECVRFPAPAAYGQMPPTLYHTPMPEIT